MDKDLYFPSKEKRIAIRKQYSIAPNDFVFGAAIRIQKIKGVFDILDACERLKFDFKFLKSYHINFNCVPFHLATLSN